MSSIRDARFNTPDNVKKKKKLCHVDGELTLSKLKDSCRLLFLDPYGKGENNETTDFSSYDDYVDLTDPTDDSLDIGDKRDDIATNFSSRSKQRDIYNSITDDSDVDDDETRREIARLRRETIRAVNVFCDRLTDPNIVHGLQVRSVPINEYCNVLRHYFVRVDELVDVHPGMVEKLTLRGWYAETDVVSDRLERQMYLCSDCLDVYLRAYWKKTKNFNIVFSNCDQAYNYGRQSLFVANLLYVTTISLYSLFAFQGSRTFGLLLLSVILLFLVVQFMAASSDKRKGVFPCNENHDENSSLDVCSHVSLSR